MMYTCEKCGTEFTEDYRKNPKTPPRFCSRACANTRSFTEESNRKKRETILARIPEQRHRKLGFCEECGTRLKTYGARKCFSCSCSTRRKLSEETKEKLRRIQLEKVKTGEHIGWQTRPIMSYPEKMVNNILQEWGYEGHYHFNYPVKKRDLGEECNAHYFLDFYFPEYGLDLEIDGKQHERKENKERDKKRDQLLKAAGYKVERLPWKGNHTAEAQDYLVTELKRILKEAGCGLVV